MEMAIYLTITHRAAEGAAARPSHAGPKKTIDAGRRKAIYNLVKYVVWVLCIMAMLDSVGVKITFLLAGATALLVGLGFGIQHLQRHRLGRGDPDEGTISVGDAIEVEGLVGRVLEIHLRTSIGTRDDITIIVPNRAS